MASTDDPSHKWNLHLVEKVELWEDPCPVWDDKGNAYLVGVIDFFEEKGNAYLVRSKVCGNALYLHKNESRWKKDTG